MTKANLSVVSLFFSALALGAAYMSQYIFNLEPCILCLYQRIPYFVVVAVACLAIMLKGKWETLFGWSYAILFMAGAMIAFYHIGVEQGIFEMTAGCVDNISATSFADMQQAIMSKPAVPCDKPQFVLFGISMAGYNFIYSLLLSAFALYRVRAI